jgi:23S rRNA (pseudouridine1915-N3)-methyltransferase
MHVRLLSVGRPRDAEAGALHDRYAQRIERFGVRYESRWVAEVRAGGRFSDDHVREREARSLIEQLDDRGTVVAVDGTGEMLSSERLAKELPRWMRPRLTLVVGGPLGLHASLLARADRCWSLSALTLPHELARVVVAEQLYRALSMLKGVPYHK